MNVFTPQVDAMHRWYQEKLGFRLTEYSEDNQGRVWAAWLHRKGNVHDIAMTSGTGPRMHHFAYWMPPQLRSTTEMGCLVVVRDPAPRMRPKYSANVESGRVSPIC